MPGPCERFFDALKEEFRELPIIAEDLGIITPEVEALRDRYEFPGMRVLQFAFGNDRMAADYRPESYPENCVCYTGTHDNDTTVGWFESAGGEGSTRNDREVKQERQNVMSYLGTDGSEIHWDFIRLALGSKANTVIVPLQDLLGLGSDARMNTPGRLGGNWQWRFVWPMLSAEIKERMRIATKDANR
jgi:4-alpha-glucanotransferase